ncbi:MAG: MCE family protein [Planctomycetes bacterium]|nr:MCE family protein [Planctomycetota bacterium]
MARTSDKKLELIVGTFIIAGIIGIAGMIISVSDFSIWSDSYPVVVRMQHVGDLQVGAPVKRGGVNIGKVTAITLRPDHIELVVSISSRAQLTSDCEARIETAGVVGDMFLEFTQGKSSNFIKHYDTVDEAKKDWIKGQPYVTMTDLFTQIQEIGVELQSITKNVNDIIGDDKVKKDIRDTIHNINGVSIEAKKLIVSLSRASKNVETATKDIVDTTGKVKKMTGTVEVAINDTIGDKANREAINETVANLRTVSRSVASKSEQIEATIDNVKVMSDKIKEIAEAIKKDKGIMKLFTSDETDKWLDQVAADIKKVADTISQVGFTDILADNKAADRIFQQFLKENRSRDAKQLWEEWQKFRAKIIDESGHLIDPKYGEEGWRGEFNQ